MGPQILPESRMILLQTAPAHLTGSSCQSGPKARGGRQRHTNNFISEISLSTSSIN
jgi:hypothetical protein